MYVDMQAKITLCLALVFVWLSSVNAIIVSPGINNTEGNCSGPLDYFLCNCTTLGTTIDFHLLPGQYYFIQQQSCFLKVNDSIRIIGNSPDDTTIECKEPFSIVFMGVRSITISNITMVNCGNVANDLINQTAQNITGNNGHLVSGFRFAMLFYQVNNIIINDFTMQNTLGYGIVSFNAKGTTTIISKLNIENTTFENDQRCKNYDYNNDIADFTCSGSGIYVLFYDSSELDPFISEADATLTIDQSSFITNRNFLPYKQFQILFNAINTGVYRTSLPLQGAGGIGIFYLQNTYDVNVTITNSTFHNNNGTLSASIAIGSLSTISGKTLIQNCVFADNNRIKRSSNETSVSVIGGISYYYATLINAPRRPHDVDRDTMDDLVIVKQCNFTKLGGTEGAAFHIEKISSNLQNVSFRIEQCMFTENEANVGSAVYAVDHRFDAVLSKGLIINLVNVNAVNNTLLPRSTVRYASTDFITGVFHSETCNFKINCTTQCNFLNNQPSVFYGQSAYLTLSGKVMFINNTARYGGGMRLLDTIAFIYQNSEVYFGKNHATTSGGAIAVDFAIINVQAACPIQFVGSTDPIFSLENIDHIPVNITFAENTASSTLVLQSIYADVFYVCSWYPNTLTQINLGINAPIVNDTRVSVYREIFNFIPASRASEHLFILAYLPCPCDETDNFNATSCLATDLDRTLELGTNVIIGRSFTVNLVTLDVVGSVGYSSYLVSEVSSFNTTENILLLPSDQLSRSFSISYKQ